MADPVLTPRIAKENGWSACAHCDRCRVLRKLNMDALFRKSPDLDLGEALARGKLRCQKCERPAEAISVTRMHVGLIKQVMMLTPGLVVSRLDEQ
jgi:hypothetical protein